MRFPQFEGEWKLSKISNILTIGNGRDYKHLKSGEIPVFGTGGYMTSVNEYLIDGETVCIGRKGTINKPFYYSGKLWTVDTLFYTYLYKKALPKFVFYVFQNIDWMRYNEASGVPSLSKKTIEQIEVYIPTQPEQSKIASLLSLLDERIATQNKIIEDLKLLKSTISNLLLRNPNWKKYKIKDIGELGRGRVISTTEIKSQQTPKYPVYSSQTSNNGIMGYLDTYAFEGEYLTWTTDGANAGTVFYRKGKFNCTNVCGTIKVNDQHNPYFVSQCLQLVTRKYVSTDLANPKLMNNTMASIEITLPDKETQEFISDLLWCIDEKYSLENELVSRHMDVKKYLLSNLFV